MHWPISFQCAGLEELLNEEETDINDVLEIIKAMQKTGALPQGSGQISPMSAIGAKLRELSHKWWFIILSTTLHVIYSACWSTQRKINLCTILFCFIDLPTLKVQSGYMAKLEYSKWLQ